MQGRTKPIPPPVHLHFHGPYPLCAETADVLAECPHRDASGIYLWTLRQHTGRYRVTYVGETTTSFYRRMKEHVIQTLGGNYRITDPDQAARGVQRVVWDGLWRKGTRDRLPEFLRRYKELAPAIKRYLLAELVFVAPMEGDARLLRRVEGALAMHLRSAPDASSLLPTDIRYVVRRADELVVRVEVKVDVGVEVEGLPQNLDV